MRAPSPDIYAGMSCRNMSTCCCLPFSGYAVLLMSHTATALESRKEGARGHLRQRFRNGTEYLGYDALDEDMEWQRRFMDEVERTNIMNQNEEFERTSRDFEQEVDRMNRQMQDDFDQFNDHVHDSFQQDSFNDHMHDYHHDNW